jgi:hypothetical protein
MNMNRAQKHIDFADTIGVLASGQVWEYEAGTPGVCPDVPKQTFEALQRPFDFPPVEASIVSGDRVALAVDPNIPGILDVIQGTINALERTPAGAIEIVVGDEAQDETVDAIASQVGDAIGVVRHHSSDRESVRYLGAGELADPIYLNRRLVDADFVLPIVAGRPLDIGSAHDLTGVFPAFADSASKRRHRQQVCQFQPQGESANPQEACFLLGVQIMISVTANSHGEVGQIIAGTPDAVRKRLAPLRRMPDEFPPAAALVIASLDGSAQQQTWWNAARAVAAASRYVESGGTIVLWSAIDASPSGRLQSLDDERALHAEQDSQQGEDFPIWDESTGPAQTLARIASEHRLLIHSRLENQTIESMGLGSVSSREQLAQLSQSYESCGVLRAAQFAGTTFDTPHRVA